jgi:hypothetical protein
MIRVLLPYHLRTLARMDSEVLLEVESPPTLSGVLDALEARYPVLRGTIATRSPGNAGLSSDSSPAKKTCHIIRRTAPYPKLSPRVRNRSWSSAPSQAANVDNAPIAGPPISAAPGILSPVRLAEPTPQASAGPDSCRIMKPF